MSKKNKMTKDIVPENFTVSLATVDAIPVLFFGLTMILIGQQFSNPIFLIGAVLSFISGAVKVLWKYIVVLQRKNVWWMFLQMRILMPMGFLMMLVGFALEAHTIQIGNVWAAVTAFPAGIFFLLGILGMVMMVVFAVKLDSSDVKANWIEQATNGFSQAAFFIGVLIILLS